MITNRRTRKVVKIDEEKCNGCGDCVPSCAEGAIKIIDGKARLMADNLCDGLGACLGHCPMDAITVEEREADDFDHEAVEAALTLMFTPVMTPVPMMGNGGAAGGGGCPGSRSRTFAGGTALRQWPVQLALLPTSGPLWEDKDVLIAADCVAFAYPEFHAQMLEGKTLAIACPKLDNVGPYVEKLAMIFAGNSILSVTVARMEVPCCSGLMRVVELAMQQSGRNIPVCEVVVGVRGAVL